MLEHVTLFSCLDPDERARLEAVALKRTVGKNTILIQEGDPTDVLYVIESGVAQAFRSDASGKQVIINRFGPGDFFGEMSFFDGRERCASVITRTPCTLLLIPRRVFLDLSGRHPQILTTIINALLERLRRATEQIETLALLDVYGRIARFLIEHQNAEGVVDIPLTHQELADTVGATRETVCRIMNELASGGYISVQKHRICILKKLPYKF